MLTIAALATVAQALAALVVLLLAAHLMGRLFDVLRQPRVMGEIVGGLLLGPTALAHFFPEGAGQLFASFGAKATLPAFVSQTGLVLLMFISGSHLRALAQRGERRVVAMLALAGVCIPLLAGLAVVPWVDMGNLIGSADSRAALLLVFATSIAIASIPVISRIMLDLGILETRFGRIVIATAVVDDIVLYVVLAAALGLVQAHGSPETGLAGLLGIEAGGSWASAYHVAATIAVWALVFLAGPPLLRRAFRAPLRLLTADQGAGAQLLFLLATTFLCKFMGVNPMFGALAAGMVARRVGSQQGLAAPASIARWAGAVLVPLYFALVGFRLDLIRHCDWLFFVEFLTFACVVKGLSIYGGSRLAGQPHSAALNFAAALNARGGPGIVLATVARDAEIINESMFSALVLLAMVTSLMAGSWLGAAVRRGVIVADGQRARRPWAPRGEKPALAPQTTT